MKCVVRALVASLVLLAAFLAASPVRAADEATKKAREHSQAAERYYNLGRWDDAISEYEKAYELRNDPALLFNLAQAHRRKGDYQRAYDLYTNYLIENPGTPLRAKIEDRLKALQTEIDSSKRASAVPQPPPPAVAPPPAPGPTQTVPTAQPMPAPVAAQPPAPAMPPPPGIAVERAASMTSPADTAGQGRGLRIAGIAVGVAGLASIATGVYFYTRAVSLSDEVSNATKWNSSDYQAGKDAESMQWVFYSAGAGATVLGIVLYALGWPSPAATRTSVAVAPIAAPGMAGLSAQGAF